MPFVKNPLLSRPPHHLHRLRDEHRIKDRVDPHLGVHTSGAWNIAAAYAMSAWKQNGRHGYPVVVALDVTGLEELPDVDALLMAKERLPEFRRDALDYLQDGDMDIWSIGEAWVSGFDEFDSVETPEGFIFHQYHSNLNPFSATMSFFSGDEDEARSILTEWAEGGELPGAVVSLMIDQRRYLTDFPLSRVVRIETFRPWYDRVIEDYWEEEDRPSEAARAEEGGYQVIYIEDLYDHGVDFHSEKVTLYKGRPSTPKTDVQYHGSWSGLIQMAFPELDLPDEYWGVEPE